MEYGSSYRRARHQAVAAGERGVTVPREHGRELVLQALAGVSRADPAYRVSAQLLGSRLRGVVYQEGHYEVPLTNSFDAWPSWAGG